MNTISRLRGHIVASVNSLCTVILASLVIALGLTAPAQAGLVITPFFDGTVTADAKTDINTAIDLFQNQFANIRNDNVRIFFKMGAIGGLGQSNGSFYTFNYNGVNGFTTALGAAATNTKNPVIGSAVNNLGSGNGAATPNNTKVETTSADARMLNADGGNLNCGACNGIFDTAGNNVGAAGTVDGIITLTTAVKNGKALLDFKRSDNFASGSFDALRTIEHEIDEILGIGGAGSNLPGNTDPSKTIGDMDLFRYGAKGAASLTTDPNATAYFSIDGGATKVAGFNQGFNNAALATVNPPFNGNCLTNNSCGDFGDWVDQTANQGPNSCGFGLVQDAFACPQQNADISLTSAEGIGLQAIGYDPAPEPGTLILLGTSLLGLGALRRQRFRLR